MKKILISLGLLTTLINASEFQYGNGTFEMEGGFIGLNKTLSTDISIYSLVEKHKNLFGSKFFYGYNLTYYQADKVTNKQENIQYITPVTIPAIDYKYEGFDIGATLGYDVLSKDETNKLGVGLYIGVSLPYIETNKSDDNDDDSSDDIFDAMKKTKTDILTMKIGPTIDGIKSLNKYLSIYGSATIAYQFGYMKNDYANSDINVDGIYQEYDIGLKFMPFKENYKFKYLTLSPRIYATIGYKYTSWLMKDVAIDVTGVGVNLQNTDFKMNTSNMYFGFGYSF
jgi:hypothetical protein